MADRRWRLAALAPMPRPALEALAAGLPVELLVPAADDPDSVGATLRRAELVICDWRQGSAALDAAAVASAPHLAFAQQPSVGVPDHDLDALAAAGVPLANAAGFNTVAVAEWVLGASFGIARQLRWVEDELRAGRWPQVSVIERGAVEIGGRRVGLVGFGPVGEALVPRFRALGCPVSYWSRSRRSPERETGVVYRELDDLVATSDVLVNVIALGPSTRDLLSAARLALLPVGALLVNASRGGIVDEGAVLEAVEAGRLAGAAFDVYATEPLPLDSPLRRSDRILLTAHTAGSTRESFRRLLDAVRENLTRSTSGEPVRNVVNGVDPVVIRRR